MDTKMKKRHRYDLQIKSIQSFIKSSDYLAAVKLHCEMLPEYMPQKWGWTEPRKPFDPNHIEQLVFENGEVDSVWWRRIEKPKATGSWMRRWESAVEFVYDTHATIDLSVFDSTFQAKLLAYMKVASQRAEADFGFLDGLNEKYQSLADQSNWSLFGGDELSLTTHILRHWLPDMPWAVVFGPAYVRMFGKERLLTTPAYKVEDLGPEMVFIQLTPNMEDIHKKYDEVMQARTIAKQHLGEECFFKPELAYDYREHPEKAGKVFRVPVFELKTD